MAHGVQDNIGNLRYTDFSNPSDMTNVILGSMYNLYTYFCLHDETVCGFYK